MNKKILLLIGGIILLSPLASSFPDGLERVAEDMGFIGTAEDSLMSIMPDYTFKMVGEGPLSTIISAVLGVILVFCLLQLLRFSKRVNRG